MLGKRTTAAIQFALDRLDGWHRPSRALLISTARAAFALTLCVVLTFILPFDNLCARPAALNSIVLVVIIGSAGKTVGGCVETLLLGGMGLSIGCLGFYVLGVVGQHHSAVGQGFIFAILVYFAALVRHQGARYISFYLYCVLFAFQGIYNTIADDPNDIHLWLLAYFQVYAWGVAIVLTTNLLVYPVSSESELRELLVNSLQHVSTLAHLTCKSYAREIGTEEKDVRDLLIQTIRSDFSKLTARLDEASFEILYTQWTMASYRDMIARVRGLQQALITSSSALDLIETLDPLGVNVKRLLLEQDKMAQTFGDFRHGIDIVIAEIVDALSGLTFAELDQRTARSGGDLEAQVSRPEHTRTPSPTYNPSPTQLADISARLRLEVLRSSDRHSKIRQSHIVPTSVFEHPMSILGDSPEPNLERKNTLARTKTSNGVPVGPGVDYFRSAWSTFAEAQSSAIVALIKDESFHVEDVLRISEGLPSLQEMYKAKLPTAWTSSLIASTPLARLKSRVPSRTSRNSREINAEANENTLVAGDEHEVLAAAGRDDVPCSEALTKSYSLLFGLGQLTDELCALHTITKNPHRKRIRFHIFDRRWLFWRRRDHEVDVMTLPEALAALRGVSYTSPPAPLIIRLAAAERWLRSDRSLYAFKVALGASVYSVLLLASGPRQFFIDYGMTSSLITIIVAIAPSLGQTLTTFLLQLLGTGIGSVYGLIVLEIFKDVGGYRYNPYGLTFAFAIWALMTSYYFYKDPRWYTGGLLATNGAGSVIIQEYLYNTLPSVEAPFPSAPLRAGQAIGVMCISIVIAAIFQIVIFRAPARRQLRLDIAAVTYGLSSYNTLLQSNINCVAPADDAPVPPPEALNKIQRELMKRETKLQGQIIALGPLFQFARMEPNLGRKFNGDALMKIIRSHQILLDRLREARVAVGTAGFNMTVHRDFASKLYPYRLHSQRLSRTLFYFGATSLQSKTPLPRDVPSSKETWAGFENDALVLTRRLSLLPHGDRELRKPGFLRYWFYLVAVGAVSGELEKLEGYLGELLGPPEMYDPWL